MSALLDAARSALAHTLDFACLCLLWGQKRKKKDYPIHRDTATGNRGESENGCVREEGKQDTRMRRLHFSLACRVH